jgi:hypothetical protein
MDVEGMPMTGKLARWRRLVVLSLVFLTPAPALAADWDDYFWWWPAPRFARGGSYSPMHYWLPERYYMRQYLHPSNLDQFPPGPTPPVAPSFDIERIRCPTRPPAPSAPYANPSAYYGRTMGTSAEQPKN